MLIADNYHKETYHSIFNLLSGAPNDGFRWVFDPNSILINGKGIYDCYDNDDYYCEYNETETSADHPSIVIGLEIFNHFLYGAPHCLAWQIVHRLIYHNVDSDKYGYTKRGVDKGQYWTILTANFMHGSTGHLGNNFTGFKWNCCRIFGYIYNNTQQTENNNTKYKFIKSSCIFWNIYVLTGIMTFTIDYIFASSWKSILCFYFRNNPKFVEDINKRLDKVNWYQPSAVGASACVFALHGFDFCINIEKIISKLLYCIGYDDEGIIDIKGTEREGFDIMDYDLEETTEGDIDWEDTTKAKIESNQIRYLTIKLFNDIWWLSYNFKWIYYGVLLRNYKNWIKGYQRLKQGELKSGSGGGIGDEPHLYGVLSGMILYTVYKLIFDRKLRH